MTLRFRSSVTNVYLIGLQQVDELLQGGNRRGQEVDVLPNAPR